MKSVDVFAEYQHGSDGVVEELSLQPGREEAKLSAFVVVRVVRVVEGVEHWFRVRARFSEVEKAQLGEDWLRGGGAVLYDGAKLDWDEASRRGRLNLDPGVAWAAGQPAKPDPESSALIAGVCDVAIEPLDGR
ncbi:MAG: hypothetical protein JNJ54_25905 [Myxococcaceae bacterium]|nr:hypothetical protein [Myxococcaceae bacterium]